MADITPTIKAALPARKPYRIPLGASTATRMVSGVLARDERDLASS